MEVQLDWGSIVIAIIASMALGAIWYHPKMFGEKWMKANKLRQKDLEEGQAKAMAVAIVRAAVLAFVMYHFIYYVDNFYSDNTWLENSLLTALFSGLGFAWITMKMHDIFEGKSHTAMAVNIGFEVVDFMLVGLVIGLVAG